MSTEEFELKPLNVVENGFTTQNRVQFTPLGINSEMSGKSSGTVTPPETINENEREKVNLDTNWTLRRQYTHFPEYNKDYSDSIKPKQIIENAIGIGYKKLLTPFYIIIIRSIQFQIFFFF